jgi:hypothetical protein
MLQNLANCAKFNEFANYSRKFANYSRKFANYSRKFANYSRKFANYSRKFANIRYECTYQMNSLQCEQNVGCLRNVAMNLCPLTW